MTSAKESEGSGKIHNFISKLKNEIELIQLQLDFSLNERSKLLVVRAANRYKIASQGDGKIS